MTALLVCIGTYTLKAECELLRAEAVKWEEDAKSLTCIQDVSTLNLRFICMSVMCFACIAIICKFCKFSS